MKFKLKDTVVVTAGKDKGKTSEIVRLYPQKHRVTVKNVNLYKRHFKGREGLESTIITKERPLSVANIAILCPTCKKPTRVGYQLPQKGNKIRICKKCHSPLDKPVQEKNQKSSKTKS